MADSTTYQKSKMLSFHRHQLFDFSPLIKWFSCYQSYREFYSAAASENTIYRRQAHQRTPCARQTAAGSFPEVGRPQGRGRDKSPQWPSALHLFMSLQHLPWLLFHICPNAIALTPGRQVVNVLHAMFWSHPFRQWKRVEPWSSFLITCLSIGWILICSKNVIQLK